MDFGEALVARGGAIRFSGILLLDEIIIGHTIIQARPRLGKPLCDRNVSGHAPHVSQVLFATS
jgi:hypothetical protein